MDCENTRKVFKDCFMVKSDCRKELDELFKCIHDKHYYFPIIPPKPIIRYIPEESPIKYPK